MTYYYQSPNIYDQQLIAARRALSLANRLKRSGDRARVFRRMNALRAKQRKMLKDLQKQTQ